MKDFFSSVKGMAGKARHRLVAFMVAVCSFVLCAVPAFASSTPPAGEAFVVEKSDLDPLLQSITANVKVIFPVMLTICGIFIVIKLVPNLMTKSATVK